MSEDAGAPTDDEAAADAALEAGFSAGAGVPATMTRDGAGAVLMDVPREGWLAAARYARDGLAMDFLDWLSAVDQPDGDPAGVDVLLHVARSDATGHGGIPRLLLRTRVPDHDPTLPSLTGLWRGAAWHERETHEMFGTGFEGFDDGSGAGLRPLLLPDGFEGTPLRKSFVLAARVAKPWPGAKEPGESEGSAPPRRRRNLPPGVPADGSWGPRHPEPRADAPGGAGNAAGETDGSGAAAGRGDPA